MCYQVLVTFFYKIWQPHRYIWQSNVWNVKYSIGLNVIHDNDELVEIDKKDTFIAQMQF